MNPSPKAAPISPYARARSLGSVTSATYARAVEMLPPDSPSTMRAAKSIHTLFASASITKLSDRAGETEHQHRPAAVAVRQIPEDRRRDQLAERKHRKQQADDERGGTEGHGVERQQRNDDPEADEVDENGEKNDEERTGHSGSGELVS